MWNAGKKEGDFLKLIIKEGYKTMFFFQCFFEGVDDSEPVLAPPSS
jgi:hypothetical protein